MVGGDEERSRSNSAKSESTSVTTPDQSQGDDDDIWVSDGEILPGEGNNGDRNPPEMLSDLPTIRRQHMTDGYREGLSVGKAQVMQQGFDDGYPIGIQIGLRAGKVLGVLEGIAASKGVADVPEKRVEVQKLYDQAKVELAIVEILKETNDQIIAEAKDVPDSVVLVLQKWETAILGSLPDQLVSSDK